MTQRNSVEIVATREPLAVITEITDRHLPPDRHDWIQRLFQEVADAFAGRRPGFEACDTPFHDFEHTCCVTVAAARLLDGHIRSGNPPHLTPRDIELGIAAALLHDIGYLKDKGDRTGTGAKLTPTHVKRSIAFAAELLPPLGVTPDELNTIQQTILATEYNSPPPFFSETNSERQRFLCAAVTTSDLLGQMAAPDYPERIPLLHQELVESSQPAPPQTRPHATVSFLLYRKNNEPAVSAPAVASTEELLRKTRNFFETHVKPRLENEWHSVYKDFAHHFPDGINHYIRAIEINIERIDRYCASHNPK